MPGPRKCNQETCDRAVRMYRERRKTNPIESMSASRKHVVGLARAINPSGAPLHPCESRPARFWVRNA
jgi:hypothetical protein